MTWFWFGCLAGLIVLAGSRVAAVGVRVARRHHLSSTWAGTILTASITSLPELFTGVSAAGVHRLPDLAVGDVLGSCMFNLFLLTLLDVASGPRTLVSRAQQGHVLTLGFGILLAAIVGFGIHASHMLPAGMAPATAAGLVGVYLVATRTIHLSQPRRPSEQGVAHGEAPRRLAGRFTASAAILVAASLALPPVAQDLATSTGLGPSVVGVALVAAATSLPEASVSLSALRRGNVDLAYGNLVGSNLFNFLILALDDTLYGAGTLLRDASPVHSVPLLAVVAMSAIAVAGLCVQSLRKVTLLAWDTLAILCVYAFALLLMLMEPRMSPEDDDAPSGRPTETRR